MDDALTDRITPVILCGGAGTRLWPLSRAARPKQMLALTGADTMLQMTAARVADPRLFAPPVVIAAAAQAQAVEAQLGADRIGSLILEPAARNTAPAIALAALRAQPNDLLLVLPSDHLILDADAFHAAVAAGAAAAREGWIVTFGMKAERAETGYGYVKRGAAIMPGVHEVERFVEKPDLATAQAYVADGGYDWNGGIFLFRAGTMVGALAKHAPAVLAGVRASLYPATDEGVRLTPDPVAFAAVPSLSIDYAVMEKAARVAVVPASLGWSDVGSFDALHDVAELDANGNAAAGEVIALGSTDCLVRTDGPLVAVIGVEDLIIVATGDAVLVARRGESQRVKEVVERLKAKGRADLL
jgi:mannose-1-phosphate guanylyltransferase